MPNLILTSSFHAVATELREKGLIPPAGVSVAFVPTAGDVYPERPWIDADRKALVEIGFRVVDVDLKDKRVDGLRDELKGFDLIFVAGGNTTYLAEHARRSGFGIVVRELLKQGKLYVGSSAGSILAGPTVEPFVAEDTLEFPPGFVAESPACLGLVDYVALPHDQVSAFAEEHDKIVATRADLKFVRMSDHEYRCEAV